MSSGPIALARHDGPLAAEVDQAHWYRLEAKMLDLDVTMKSIEGLDAVTFSALTAEDTRPRCLPHESGAHLARC